MAPGSSSGRSGGSFPEQRLVIEPTRRPAVEFLLRVVHLCGPAMSGIIKVVVSFFRKGEVIRSRKVFQNFLLSSYNGLRVLDVLIEMSSDSKNLVGILVEDSI